MSKAAIEAIEFTMPSLSLGLSPRTPSPRVPVPRKGFTAVAHIGKHEMMMQIAKPWTLHVPQAACYPIGCASQLTAQLAGHAPQPSPLLMQADSKLCIRVTTTQKKRFCDAVLRQLLLTVLGIHLQS